MRFSYTSALLVAAGASGALGQNVQSAPVVQGNPSGKTYVATLPEQPFFTTGSLDGNVKGSIVAKAGPGGAGVQFDISFSNIPKEGGPFAYHLHVDPSAPSGGNCTSTLAHLDPFARGEDPACDSTMPETCQVGDLSGKHGKITSDPFTASYVDPYLSLQTAVGGSFFGNRSFVFHFSNKTRISCADFYLLESNSTTPPYPTGGYPTGSPAPTTSVPVVAAANMLGAATGSFFVIPVLAWFFL